ncbi:hypothetical protein K2X85_02770 [bacterium]|nr:hypothetical protein [bacterium]
MASLDADKLTETAQAEGSLADRLRSSLAVEVALDPRLPTTRLSLRSAIERLPATDRAPLERRLADLIPQAQTLQEEAATQWLSIWRLNEHVSGMIDILARAGQPAEVDVHHGLMFDATA